MDYIGEYSVLEEIHKTRSTLVVRAQKPGRTGTVVIKYLRARYPSSYEISRFIQEYEIIRNLDVEGVIKTHEIIDSDEGIALVLEDFDAVSIKNLIRGKKIDLALFFSLAMKTVEILGNLHKKNVIHRDIKPSNILVGKDLETLKITDFGIAHIVTHENEDIYNPEVIEGTLRYMSPEQTGRMNRAVDYRTDLYSLGITFYEMLTGTPPFNFDDPLEIIHAHIAKQVTPPHELASWIPEVISDIIHKLLIKPAEERYQNAFGLLYDLRLAYGQWREKGRIEKFELATRDFSLKFNIPQQIVGREKETAILLEAFERAAQNSMPEALFVAGRPGVGKSFLVEELYKSIAAKKAYFISGKYEQFRKDVPYSSIIQSFIKLISQILAENSPRIEQWKKLLQEALGDNARVITEVIPQLKAIIGEPPEVPELGPEASEQRFHYVFKKFLRVFTTSGRPLVLVLDDLQWADSASLNLIQNDLLTPDNGSLFFIGIYRDNEVEATHRLHTVLQSLNDSELTVNTITLAPLDRNLVAKLLARFLRLDYSEVESLADIVYRKTNGNPFFINQFLKRLYEKNLLELDTAGKWKWDDRTVASMQVTDNVVDLMVEKIKDLSGPAQEVLKVAGCIGNRFDLETMSIVTGRPAREILSDMREAIDGGFLYFSGDTCYFLHDRIQEAAYSIIAEEEKTLLHYTIGSYIYRSTEQKNLQEKIFYIVNQLNAGLNSIQNREEQRQIAGLNLMAGQKARGSAAYQSALAYFKTGISLLSHKDWEQNYQLAYDLYVGAAEASYLTADFSGMEKYLTRAIQHSSGLLDSTKIHEIRIRAYMARNMLTEAADQTREVLSRLGMKMPKTTKKFHLAKEFYKTRIFFKGKKDPDILSRPEIDDPLRLALIRVATTAAPAFYLISAQNHDITYLVLKTVRLSVSKGVCPQTPYWLSCYAMTLFAVKYTEDAFRYANLALSLGEKLAVQEIRHMYLINSFISHWRSHVRGSMEEFLKLYHRGFELGDIETSLFSASFYCEFLVTCGEKLTAASREIENISEVSRQYKIDTLYNYNAIAHQVVENLLGNADDPAILKGEKYNGPAMIEKYRKTNDSMGLFATHLFSAMLAYLFAKTDKAGLEIQHARKHLYIATGGAYSLSVYYYYRALIIMAQISENSWPADKKTLKKLSYYNSRLKNWAGSAPMNFFHRHLLVSAELARIKGDTARAQDLYEKAAKAARQTGHVNDEALCLELAAKFYRKRELDHIAALYLIRSIDCYRRWEASAKAEQLASDHSGLLAMLNNASRAKTAPLPDDTESTSTAAAIDMQTVLKASRAISGQLALEKLLEQMIKIGIENAGAQRGVLLLQKDGGLFVEAAGDTSGKVETSGSVPIDAYPELPLSVINYVFKTRETVVLDNACTDERFSADPCVEQKKIRSILCLPIEHKDDSAVILYLENNLTTNAFTTDRIEVLRLISSQAAISIENARLFEMARRDGLTELINHRFFIYTLEKEIEAAGKSGHRVWLLMIDIDHFKQFNDTFGHQVGDLVLKRVAATLKKAAPDKDLAARYGGEEFSVIMPQTEEPGARAAAEKIRTEVENTSITQGGQELRVTISIGMAAFPDRASGAEELVKESDQALYASKEAGRNRITLY